MADGFWYNSQPVSLLLFISSPDYSEVIPAVEVKDFFLAELSHSELHNPLC